MIDLGKAVHMEFEIEKPLVGGFTGGDAVARRMIAAEAVRVGFDKNVTAGPERPGKDVLILRSKTFYEKNRDFHERYYRENAEKLARLYMWKVVKAKTVSNTPDKEASDVVGDESK